MVPDTASIDTEAAIPLQHRRCFFHDGGYRSRQPGTVHQRRCSRRACGHRDAHCRCASGDRKTAGHGSLDRRAAGKGIAVEQLAQLEQLAKLEQLAELGQLE